MADSGVESMHTYGVRSIHVYLLSKHGPSRGVVDGGTRVEAQRGDVDDVARPQYVVNGN